MNGEHVAFRPRLLTVEPPIPRKQARADFAGTPFAFVYKQGRTMAAPTNQPVPDAVAQFISRWSAASISERSNSQLFLTELCDILGTPAPDPKPYSGYAFEFQVTENHPDGTASRGWIDLFKRGCFVLESKQYEEAKVESSQLELAAEEAGVITRKNPPNPCAARKPGTKR